MIYSTYNLTYRNWVDVRWAILGEKNYKTNKLDELIFSGHEIVTVTRWNSSTNQLFRMLLVYRFVRCWGKLLQVNHYTIIADMASNNGLIMGWNYQVEYMYAQIMIPKISNHCIVSLVQLKTFKNSFKYHLPSHIVCLQMHENKS